MAGGTDQAGIIWLEVLVRLVLYGWRYWPGRCYMAGVLIRQVFYGWRYWSGWYYIAGGTGQAGMAEGTDQAGIIWLEVLVRLVLYA